MALPVAVQAGRAAWRYRPRINPGSQVTSLLLAAGTAAGVFLGVRAVVRTFKQDLRGRQALTEGNPASYAIQLKMAFENDNYFGWGTDEKTVYAVMESIPDSRVLAKVQRAYRDLYNRNLSLDLKEELDTEEYARVLEIVQSMT